jgi:membrane dipeptidase
MHLVMAALLASQLDANASKDPLWAKALEIHRKAIVVDTHSDTTSPMTDEGFDFGTLSAKTHMDLPRMKEGGLDAEFFAIYVAGKYAKDGGSARRALDMIDSVRRMVERYPDKILLATTAADVRRLKKEGRIAALMGIEGGHAIENSIPALRSFFDLGVRYMTLTHSNTNDWADSSGDKPRWGGLNDLGRKVVAEMNRIGMIVDTSHVSDETFYDVIESATAPPFASHSSCRAICGHARNMTDDMIKALARKGGVIQINFFSGFLDEDYRKAMEARREKVKAELEAKYPGNADKATEETYKAMRAMPPVPPPGLARLIEHIDHAVKVGGADAVGLGSDFDGVDSLPVGMENVTKLPAITYELLKRGYSEADVIKILGGNTLRVMEAVEAEAKRLQSVR